MKLINKFITFLNSFRKYGPVTRNGRRYPKKLLLKELENLQKRSQRKKDNVPIVVNRSVIPVKDMPVSDVEKELDELNKRVRDA